MANISPGVYTKIIDLSNYVQAVPSTIGMICALTEKGPDNKITFVGGRSELISKWGEPNIATYGKNYGQGAYCAYNFLGESGSLYFMRCLPDDAQFANMRIDVSNSDTTGTISITYTDTINATSEFKSDLTTSSQAIAYLYPVGRGVWYNGLGVRFTEYANPMVDGIYVMDIYEKQTDGDDVIIESFEVSFDPTAMDSAGDSIYIKYILDTYSSVLRCIMTKADGSYSGGYETVARVFDKNIGNVSATITNGVASLTDNKQDFSDWEDTVGVANYVVTAIDGKGNKIWGWLGNDTTAATEEIIFVYDDKQMTTQDWNGAVNSFDINSDITYKIKKSYSDVASAFTSATPVPFKKGSDGALLQADGSIDTAEATTLLSSAYAGTVDEDILDYENLYFTLVFDCGYPSDVKTQISSLVQTRRDCVAIMDNGDNASYTTAMTSRNDTHTFNNYYCTMYECYNKVFDIWTGQDVWFSPVYHMSYLLPRNDAVAEIWYAAAGFTRGVIDSIKELRFNPRLGQRDQMYLKQLNPIVKFNPGYVVWGQLTSQSKASAMQDLNIVRLVLYCKRALEQYCRYFIFEQNDAITWNLVSGGIIEFLEDIKKRRGLYSYGVEVGATEYEKKKKTFHVNVTLNPTRVVEKVELNFFIV